MESFVNQLKKILVGEATEADVKSFETELNNNIELKVLYEVLLSKSIFDNSEIEELEAEKAYALHMVKMQLRGLI